MRNRTLYEAFSRRRTRDRASQGRDGIVLALVAGLAAAAGAVLAALALFPAGQIWPAAMMGLLLAAAATALLAFAAPTEAGRARVLFWDVAGVMAAMGILCAALIGEPEPAVTLLERQR